MPQIPAGEYQARMKKMTDLLDVSGLDALLLTAEANVNYFTGYVPWSSWTTFTRPTVLLISKLAPPILIVQDVWLGAARRDSQIGDIRGYSRLGGLPVDIVSQALADMGLANSRIGAELGYEQRLGVSYIDFDAIKQHVPRCAFVDASSLIWKLRTIKSKAEIACIKEACKGAFTVFESAFDSIRAGMTEHQVVQFFHRAAAEIGMDIGFIIPVTGPASYHAMTSRTTGRELVNGDMVWVDLSLIHCDYRSDFSRAAVVGGPSDGQKRLWEQVHNVTMSGVKRMAPGVPITEVVLACSEEASRRGLSIGSFSTGRLGHGIGLMTTEPPHISLYDNTVLEPGMVLAIEPGVITDDGVFVAEQDVAITESGFEILTEGFWELQTIQGAAPAVGITA